MGDMHSMTIEEKGDSFRCIRCCKKFTNEEVVHDSPLASLKFIEKYTPYFDLSFKEFEDVLGISAFPFQLKSMEKSGVVMYRKGSDYCGEIRAQDVHFDSEKLKAARIAFTAVELGQDGSDVFDDEEELAVIYVPSRG